MTACSHPILSFRAAVSLRDARVRAGAHVEVQLCEECAGYVLAPPLGWEELEQLAGRLRARAGNAPPGEPAPDPG